MRFIGIKGWFPPDLGDTSPGNWAPDNCYLTFHDYETIVTYKPIDGKELEIQPPQMCRTVENYKRLKEMGFTHLMATMSLEDMKNAFRAGWTPDEITIWVDDPEGKVLKQMQNHPEFSYTDAFDQYIKDYMFWFTKIRHDQYGEDVGDGDYSFYSIFFDEPHRTFEGLDYTVFHALVNYIRGQRAAGNTLYNGTFSNPTLIELSEYDEFLTTYVADQAHLIDYIYYSGYENMPDIGDIAVSLLSGGSWEDDIKNQIPYWSWIRQQGELSGKLKGAWISLYRDHGEYSELLLAANRYGWSHMKVYGGSINEGARWSSCEEFFTYLRKFLFEASQSGWVEMNETTKVLSTTHRKYCKHYDPNSDQPCGKCDPTNPNDWQDAPPYGLPKEPYAPGGGVVRIQRPLKENEGRIDKERLQR